MSVVHYEVKGRVAVLTIANPPVNALSPAVWATLEEMMMRAAADGAVDAVVLTGHGRTFVAGSDIAAFDALTTREASLERLARRHAVLRRFEDVAKPVVAAIHGHALGGGLELAMACHYRVASRDAAIGQPEVLLGLIPGAGGSQRLPRLCGPALALRMCTSGQPITAAEALAAGIIDAVVDDDVLDYAVAFAVARAAAGDRRPTSAITIDAGQAAAGQSACADDTGPPAASGPLRRRVLRGRSRPSRAASRCRSTMERAVSASSSPNASSRPSPRPSGTCSSPSATPSSWPTSRRAAPPRSPARPWSAPARWGSGIAIAYANAGIPVTLSDVDPAALDRGLASIRTHYESAMAKGRMNAVDGEQAIARVTAAAASRRARQRGYRGRGGLRGPAATQALFAALGRIAPARLHPGLQHLHARHRRARRRQRPAGERDWPPLRQPRARHEAAGDRPWP